MCFIAVSSVDGMVYLVPEGTEKDLEVIREVSIDTVFAVALNSVYISTTGLDNGVYWLYARDWWRPDNISDHVAIIIRGVGIEKKLMNDIRIYPNPATDFLTIETGTSELCNIKIRSLNGQLIFNKEMEGPLNHIALSSFDKGLYFITIKTKNFLTTSKLIKL
jgi:hypothetical protein